MFVIHVAWVPSEFQQGGSQVDCGTCTAQRPANICRLALSAISRVQMDIHGGSAWATHGDSACPWQAPAQLTSWSACPKDAAVCVRAEGQYILQLVTEPRTQSGSPTDQGHVRGGPVSVRAARPHRSCEEPLLPAPALP